MPGLPKSTFCSGRRCLRIIDPGDQVVVLPVFDVGEDGTLVVVSTLVRAMHVSCFDDMAELTRYESTDGE